MQNEGAKQSSRSKGASTRAVSICLVRELLSEVAIVEALERQGRGEEHEDRGWQEGCRNCEQESKLLHRAM